MASIFVNEQGAVRNGWRAVAFLLLSVIVVTVLIAASRELPEEVAFWLPEVYLSALAVLGVTWLFMRLEGRPIAAVGLELSQRALCQFGVGMAYGAGLVLATALLVVALGGLHFEIAPQVSVIDIVKTGLFMAGAVMFEETLFRGYAFQALVEAVGVWPTVLATSALFSLAHLGNPEIDAIGIANIFLAGVLLAFAYLRTRSLWFPTALHAGWNWTMASALGFPVSGLVLMDTPLYDAVETGSDWWTGGSFGPEAGLAGTAVLLAGIAWLLRTRALSEPPEMRALRPLVDSRLREEGA